MCERICLAEQLAEDCSFFERTPMYPVERKIKVELKATHFVIYVYVSPCNMLQPTRRARVLSFMVNLRTLRWLGPASQAGIERDFERRFYGEVGVAGCMFMCDSRRIAGAILFCVLFTL